MRKPPYAPEQIDASPRPLGDYLNRTTQISQHAQPGGSAVADKRVDFAYDTDSGQLASLTRYADQAATQFVANTVYTYVIMPMARDR